MNEFESKMMVFFKDSWLEGFEQLLNSIDKDFDMFKKAAKNDFIKLKDRIK